MDLSVEFLLKFNNIIVPFVCQQMVAFCQVVLFKLYYSCVMRFKVLSYLQGDTL